MPKGYNRIYKNVIISAFIVSLLIGISGIVLYLLSNVNIDIDNFSRRLDSSDFDNDGWSDILVMHYDIETNRSWFSIHINNNGILREYNNYKLPKDTREYTIIDFNNDSYDDLIFTNPNEDSIILFQNDCSGKFDKIMDISTIKKPHCICSSDLNLDGLYDLIITSDSNYYCSILINDLQNDSIQFKELTRTKLVPCKILKWCDLNSDTFSDIVLVEDQTRKISIYFYNNNNNFTHVRDIFNSQKILTSMELADFNNDGYHDIVCNGLTVYMNDGSFNFSKKYSFDNDYLGEIKTQDINGDNRTDILSSLGVIFYNRDNCDFEPVREIWTIKYSISLGRFDNDEEPDIIGLSMENDGEEEKMILIPGKGDGRFTFGPEYAQFFTIIVFTILSINLIILIYFYLKYFSIKLTNKRDNNFSPIIGWEVYKHKKIDGAGLFILFFILITLFSGMYHYLIYPYRLGLLSPFITLSMGLPLVVPIFLWTPKIMIERLKFLRSNVKEFSANFKIMKINIENVLDNYRLDFKKMYEQVKIWLIQEQKSSDNASSQLKKITKYSNSQRYFIKEPKFQILLLPVSETVIKAGEKRKYKVIFANINQQNLQLIKSLQAGIDHSKKNAL